MIHDGTILTGTERPNPGEHAERLSWSQCFSRFLAPDASRRGWNTQCLAQLARHPLESCGKEIISVVGLVADRSACEVKSHRPAGTGAAARHAAPQRIAVAKASAFMGRRTGI